MGFLWLLLLIYLLTSSPKVSPPQDKDKKPQSGQSSSGGDKPKDGEKKDPSKMDLQSNKKFDHQWESYNYDSKTNYKQEKQSQNPDQFINRTKSCNIENNLD